MAFTATVKSMEAIQRGHAGAPRGQTIVPNDAFIEQVGEAGVARYVEGARRGR